MKKFTVACLSAVVAVGLLLTGCSPSGADSGLKENDKQLLLQTKELAETGNVISAKELGVNSSRTAIEKKWGKADTDSTPSQLKYSKYFTNFNFDVKDNELVSAVEVDITDKRYESITYDQVINTLGTPNQSGSIKDEHYVSYSVGTNPYELRFGFIQQKNGTQGTSKIKKVIIRESN